MPNESPKRALPLCAGLLVAACGGEVPPPAASPPLPSPAPRVEAPSPVPPPPASPSLAVSPPTPQAARAAAQPLAEPLLPLTRPFVTVQLAGVDAELVSVGGRGPRDLWFLTPEEGGEKFHPTIGQVIHHDGKRLLERIVPCPAYAYGRLFVARDEVLVEGANMYFRGVAGHVWASVGGGGKDCNGIEFSSGLAVAASGGRAWRLACDYGGGRCSLQASGAPEAALPRVYPSLGAAEEELGGVEALWMRADDDGWMAHRDEDGRALLLRYNGVTWTPRAVLDDGLEVANLWVDEDGLVWLAARPSGGAWNAPATAVLRFDGRALAEVAVPPAFAARFVRATGARDVWFLGAGVDVYQWDGQRMRQGKAPFVAADAWAAPGGEVWIVEGEKGGKGVAAHTAPAPSEAR